MIDTIQAYTSDVHPKMIDNLSKFFIEDKHDFRRDIDIRTYNVNGVTFKLILKDAEPIKLMLSGSLTKFFFGNNVVNSDRFSSSRALVRLIRKTRIKKLRHFKVTKVDFATNIKLRFPVAKYIAKMSKPSRFRRTYNLQGSIRFESRGGKLKYRIYNKIKDAIKKGETKGLTKSDLSSNILRFEFSMQYNLKKFSITEKDYLPLVDITRPEFFLKLTKILKDRFNKIEFVSTQNINGITDSKDVSDFLQFKGIQKLGGIEKAHGLIGQLRDTGKINKNQHDHLIRKTRQLVSKAFEMSDDQLVAEMKHLFYRGIRRLKKESKRAL